MEVVMVYIVVITPAGDNTAHPHVRQCCDRGGDLISVIKAILCGDTGAVKVWRRLIVAGIKTGCSEGLARREGGRQGSNTLLIEYCEGRNDTLLLMLSHL